MTIVAAWIRADTGVGPAIASPSQDCSGNCADLPQAPSSSIRPIAVSTPSLAPSADAARPSAKSTAAELAEHDHDRDGQPEVTDPVGHERLLRRRGVGRVVVPEPDQQVRRQTDALPADVQHQVGVGEHEQQHRRDEEVEVARRSAACPGRAPCSRSSRRGSATPTKVISSTKHIDSGSMSRPASTLERRRPASSCRAARATARSSVSRPSIATNCSDADEEGRPGQPVAEQGAEPVGAPAAEQQDHGTEQGQRDEQPGDAVTPVAAAAAAFGGARVSHGGSSRLQQVGAVDRGRPAGAEDRHDDRQADDDLGGRDDHDEEGDDLAVEVAVHRGRRSRRRGSSR